MRQRWTWIIACAFLRLFVGVPFVYAETFGVFIGINDHATPSFRGLRFAESDATRVGELLIQSQAVEQKNARFLLGKSATKEAVRVAIRQWLRERTHEEDEVLIYFSGYGGLVTHGSAEDGTSPRFLISYDSSTDDVSSLIFCDELNEWLDEVPARKQLIVLDCGFTDQGIPQEFFGDHRQKSVFLESSSGERYEGKFAKETKDKTRLIHRVQLFACQPYQVAVESATLRHGVLTDAIVEGIRGTFKATTYRGWADQLYRKMRRRSYRQEPQIFAQTLSAAHEAPLLRLFQQQAPPRERHPQPFGILLRLRVQGNVPSPLTHAPELAAQFANVLRDELKSAQGVEIVDDRTPPDRLLFTDARQSVAVRSQDATTVDLFVSLIDPNSGSREEVFRFSNAMPGTIEYAAARFRDALSERIAANVVRKRMLALDEFYDDSTLHMEVPDRLDVGNDLRIRALPSRSGSLVIFALGTDGRLTVLWPNRLVRDTHVNSGQEIILPDGEWRLRVAGPPGLEVIVAVLAVHPLKLDVVRDSVDDSVGYSMKASEALNWTEKLITQLKMAIGTVATRTLIVGSWMSGPRDPLELNSLE